MFNVDILRPLSVIRPLCLCIKNKKKLIYVNIRFARTHSTIGQLLFLLSIEELEQKHARISTCHGLSGFVACILAKRNASVTSQC